ncbi:MAG: hypothetical protein ACKOSS_09930 [Planctomycetia bacterium]
MTGVTFRGRAARGVAAARLPPARSVGGALRGLEGLVGPDTLAGLDGLEASVEGSSPVALAGGVATGRVRGRGAALSSRGDTRVPPPLPCGRPTGRLGQPGVACARPPAAAVPLAGGRVDGGLGGGVSTGKVRGRAGTGVLAVAGAAGITAGRVLLGMR